MNRDQLLSGAAFRYNGLLRPISGHTFTLNRHYGNLVDADGPDQFPLLAIHDDGFTLMKTHLPEKRILFSECSLLA
jgi:hypothetical protein